MSRNTAQVVLHVELLDVRPRVWRSLRVPTLMLLTDLHRVLQVALGWEYRQPYVFHIGDKAVVAPGGSAATALTDDASVWTVGRATSVGGPEIHYLYDPGDKWVHRIRVDPAGRSVPGGTPRCLAGQNACPPEDVGGPAGYHLFLAALADDEHPDHALYADWVGGIWDPAGFDINGVNRVLREYGAQVARGAAARR